MLRSAFYNIKNNIEVRKNLILIKELLREDVTKNSHNKEALYYVMAGDYEVFSKLLSDRDAKIRKNTALIIGEMTLPGFLEQLFESYEAEEQRFVRSAYLTAICHYDYESLYPKLKQQYEKLCQIPLTEENKKHLSEELRILEQMLREKTLSKKHKFIGYECMNELVLLCNRNHIHITSEQIIHAAKKEFSAGLMVKTKALKEILPIRTYRELLFTVPLVKTVPNDVVAAAKLLTDGTIYQFLKERHNEDGPFYFRIELKSKMDPDKKSSFVKRLATEMEHLSERTLRNSVSDYEVEIRLIENKEGRFNVLLRLFTICDQRFLYRKEVVAASIHPVNAALCIELARPYLKENAQVLDPFCGVGTMLIERKQATLVKSMYGIDSFAEAIDKARVNAKRADVIINFINRDFFDFTHEYLFDEIITNMPGTGVLMGERELSVLYERFFQKAKSHLKDDGVIVLYSHNREFVKKFAKQEGYQIEKEFEISMMEGTYVYIIKVHHKTT